MQSPKLELKSIMEIDQSEDEIDRSSDVLRNLSAKGPLPISMAKLSGSSRIIPSQKDFHFYNNFQEFKHPVQEFDRNSKNLLEKIGASENLFGKPIPLPDDKDIELDDDVALDWLVNVNDEIFERFDVSLDDFKRLRKGEEEHVVRTMRVNDEEEEDGFQIFYGKKNKKPVAGMGKNVDMEVKGVQEVKVAAKLKPKIPFHVPTITKPQDEHKIIVNNSNQPFEHVWLQRSEDGSRFLHPLEQLSVLDFVDESGSITEPEKPLPIEVTPFTFVKDVKDLKQLANKLRNVNEFAVDLEHNQYRSFQGLTCLMQISTRTEDFIIDTLKLRIHIGPYLREVFKDPTKRKVLHGANCDIAWLQRDFGIYVCNMFDTGQASRVLKMERYSLEHLLSHFCGVTANKEYQNADWRIRPLPQEMIKYGREDTHYLLYIYDLMRIRLLSLPADSESSDPPLIEVYKRSYNLCTQLYEKELLTETSYLHIYGVQSAELNAQQLAVVSGLYEWRDVVARAEDESTGYVLPNRTLIEIAKQMPLTPSHLRRVLKSKLPYIERNLGSVVSMIRHSIQNTAAFEEAAKLLKEKRLEMEVNNALAVEEAEALHSDAPDEILKNAEEIDNMQSSTSPKDHVVWSSNSKVDVHGDPEDKHINLSSSHPAEATVQLLKKPSRGFGALLGNLGKRNFNSDKAEEKDTKLEHIKSTVSLPFHSFSGSGEILQMSVEESPSKLEILHPASAPATSSTLEDIIILGDDNSDIEDSKGNSGSTPNGDLKQVENNETSSGSDGDEPMSLSDLASSFQKCLPSTTVTKAVAAEGLFQLKPFDYEAARKEVKFGQNRGGEATEEGDGSNRRRDRKKGLVSKDNKAGKNEESADFVQGKRRQAFPASGNRSATFR